jgi:hypothetical protein
MRTPVWALRRALKTTVHDVTPGLAGAFEEARRLIDAGVADETLFARGLPTRLDFAVLGELITTRAQTLVVSCQWQEADR